MTNLSSCCNATVSVENGGGTTHWHVCKKCTKACDIAEVDNSPCANKILCDGFCTGRCQIKDSYDRGYAQGMAETSDLLKKKIDYLETIAKCGNIPYSEAVKLQEDWKMMKQYIQIRAKTIPNEPFDPEAERIIQALQYPPL